MLVPNLTRDDARTRAALLHVESYDVALDLTDGNGGPSERTFSSVTTVRFGAQRAGGSTFVDLIADRVRHARLNGVELDLRDYEPQDGLVLPDLVLDNELVVEADCLYTTTGEGLHRFHDPVDDEVYVYTQFETADAKRVFACFDQPDLKATFALSVTAPSHWELVSNGRVESVEQQTEGKTVHFATTPRISTYITALVAGKYSVFRDHHDGIDLGVYCRSSLAEYMDAQEIFEVTKQGFDWYHANFGTRYAFDKYDQLFVPEFNAGAMENAGCVTFRDQYVFRSRVTDTRRERRAETILHEMAHMWFGDLVTMTWWDDLWLNESFATYISALCQAEATRWSTAWTTFANTEKTWAYRQDQLPSTHPIATDAPDVQTAEVNFDGITYAKGASVLKQLSAYVGVEAFLAGLRSYFTDFAYANTQLSDLLSALEKSSGRDLSSWSKVWLETTGINTLRPEFSLDESGHYAGIEVVQEAPDEVATTNTLRPHRLAIGLYNDDPSSGTLVRTGRVELDVDGPRTVVEQLIGVAQPDLLLINDDDLTYGKVRLDDRSLRTLQNGGITRLADSLPRALAWTAAWDMVRDGEMGLGAFLDLIVASAEQPEQLDIGVLQAVLAQCARGISVFAAPDRIADYRARLADTALSALERAGAGSDHQLAWAHAFIGAARSPEHVEVLRGLLDGSRGFDGLAIDTDLRWSLVMSLAGKGELDDAAIEAEKQRDNTDAGAQHALTARALRPTAEAKAEAWRLTVETDELNNQSQLAVISGFSHPDQAELLVPYVARYFADMPTVWQRRTSEVAQNAVIGLFPSWSGAISTDTVAQADRFLADPDVAPQLRRLVSEGRAEVTRALSARERDARDHV